MQAGSWYGTWFQNALCRRFVSLNCRFVCNERCRSGTLVGNRLSRAFLFVTCLRSCQTACQRSDLYRQAGRPPSMAWHRYSYLRGFLMLSAEVEWPTIAVSCNNYHNCTSGYLSGSWTRRLIFSIWTPSSYIYYTVHTYAMFVLLFRL
jgi:hypothetical protein